MSVVFGQFNSSQDYHTLPLRDLNQLGFLSPILVSFSHFLSVDEFHVCSGCFPSFLDSLLSMLIVFGTHGTTICLGHEPNSL